MDPEVGEINPLAHFNGGGLAGTVRPEQTEHLPARNPQVEPVDGGFAAVGLVYPAEL